MKLLVFIQFEDGNINRMSLETLACAQKNCNSVSAVTFHKEAANELQNYEVEEVLLIENQNLNFYNPLFYTETVYKIFKKDYNGILFAHTYETRDWVPRLSAKLDIPFISDCIDFKIENESILITRQTYQGKLNNDLIPKEKFLCSIQSGCFKIDTLKKGSSPINIENIELDNVTNTISTEEKFKDQKGGVDLTAAELIVSVGRGIGKEENLPIAQELKEVLNAELGSSRPIVDYGWLPHDRQIGSSGQVVSPKLYFSLGVSGAIQHQVGMKGSDNIMAINKDENAPIFEIADYAVIGDILEIVPKLIERIKES